MPEDRIRYRRLPGKRRGILMGSSVWLGPDHLLLVKSARFREDYKRFYFRDIQAIVVAEAPRFHLSTRSLLIGALWLLAFLIALAASFLTRSTVAWVLGLCGLALVFAWVYISAVHSCRCRILTAVSSDELPSLYRIWTARRFLARVEPHIAQVQGVIEGNWADAAEERQIGPLAEGRLPVGRGAAAMPGMVFLPGEAPVAALPPLPGMPMPQNAAAPALVVARSRTVPAILFVATLLLGGAAELMTVGTGVLPARWVVLISILLQVGAAVAVLVQNFQGALQPALRNLAIVMLAATGLWYYSVQIASGMLIGIDNAKHPDRATVDLQENQIAFINYTWSRGSAGIINLLLGLTGVILLLRGDRPDQAVSFTV